jgi:ribosomal protein S25
LADRRRGSLARRYSFVVEADILEPFRKPDWTGFFAGAEVNAARKAVHRHIIQTLNQLQSANRKERKKIALEQTKSALRDMTTISRQQVARFIDEVQESCPTISEASKRMATKMNNLNSLAEIDLTRVR